jgi:hypothetical protein
MSKDLIKMRQVRAKQVKVKSALIRHEAYAKMFRENITKAWDKEGKDDVVASNGRMLDIARQGITECQTTLRALKREMREHNRHYDLRHSK